MNDLGLYTFQDYSGRIASESAEFVNAVSSIFSNSFGKNPNTDKPYRLGPTTTKKRLALTHRLFLALHKNVDYVGYLFATEIACSKGLVGWIDSLAVLPQYRRNGVGTKLVQNFTEHFQSVRWIGCATPNPVAALVIIKVVQGKWYIGPRKKTKELIAMIHEIRPLCQDLRGAEFNQKLLLVRTGFQPSDTGDSKEWCPPHPMEPPPWWSSLKNLGQYEALLFVDTNHKR